MFSSSKTNFFYHASKVYNVVTILSLQFMVHVMLFPTVNVLYFYVQCPIWLFSAVPLFSAFPYAAWVYFEWFWDSFSYPYFILVSLLFFTIHMGCITIVRFVYCRIFAASFLTTFLSSEIVTSISIRVPFSLSWIMMSGLLFGVVPPFCTFWFHNMVTLNSGRVSTDFSRSSHQCSLYNNITPSFLA